MQVEFGAHQVIIVRTLESIKRLPEEIRNSNAIFLTVPQAKGLEFDDGEHFHTLSHTWFSYQTNPGVQPAPTVFSPCPPVTAPLSAPTVFSPCPPVTAPLSTFLPCSLPHQLLPGLRGHLRVACPVKLPGSRQGG